MNQTTPQPESTDHALLTERDPRCDRVFRAAKRLYDERPDWATFFRTILGPGGIIPREFPSLRDLARFEQTETYAKIQQWLTRLRERQPADPDQQEPTRVITVRLPESLHEALRIEAHQHCTSMNKLCISKLLQVIEGELVPNQPFRLSAKRGNRSRGTVPLPVRQSAEEPTRKRGRKEGIVGR